MEEEKFTNFARVMEIVKKNEHIAKMRVLESWIESYFQNQLNREVDVANLLYERIYGFISCLLDFDIIDLETYALLIHYIVYWDEM